MQFRRFTLVKAFVTLFSFLAFSVSVSSAPAGHDFHPTATIKDLMVSMVDPSADAIWESVATIVTIEGVEERRPRTDEDWAVLRIEAIRLVESTNLLKVEGRRVAAPGVPSENPGIELHPEEIDELIATDPDTWKAMVDALYFESTKMLDAVDHRDADKIFEHGEALDAVCEACHRRYWYPENVGSVSRK